MLVLKTKTVVNFFILFTTAVVADTKNSVSLCSDSEVDYQNYSHIKTEICGCEQERSCVRKCCQSGFHHFHDEKPDKGIYFSICVKKSKANFSVPIYDGLERVYWEDKFIVGMLDCKNDQYLQYFKLNNDDPKQRFYIQKNGSLYYEYYKKIYSNDRYCIDERDGLTAFLCFTPRKKVVENETDVVENSVIHVLAKVTSLPFLLITFIVYAVLPRRSLHGKALISHVLSLIFGNSCLAVVQYYKIQDNVLCQVLGYIIIFFMHTSFFWMSIMCTDIWLAFSGFRGRITKKTLFLKCCFYAWGIPLLIILVIFINFYGEEESLFYTSVYTGYCDVNGNLQIFLYYFGPILILAVINTILFILTAINIQKVRRETSVLKQTGSNRHSSNEDNTKKFSMYWKLLFTMGINPVINVHVIQAISFGAGLKLQYQNGVKYIFYFKDLSHALYGIFIFITYVCKWNVWNELKRRYIAFTGKQIMANVVPEIVLPNLSVPEAATAEKSGRDYNEEVEEVL